MRLTLSPTTALNQSGKCDRDRVEVYITISLIYNATVNTKSNCPHQTALGLTCRRYRYRKEIRVGPKRSG
jgi:hypothetical protein